MRIVSTACLLQKPVLRHCAVLVSFQRVDLATSACCKLSLHFHRCRIRAAQSVKMSGLVQINSAAEWQSLLSSTNVVIADCTIPPPQPAVPFTVLSAP